MGCMPSKDGQAISIVRPSSKISPEGAVHMDNKRPSIKAYLLDAIKRADLISFEKTMHTYEVKPTEVIGKDDQKKTILHYIAQSNFAEGMTLALEYILQSRPNEAFQATNIKDSNGNTPAIICCMHDSTETLQVLLKSGLVNLNIKNNIGKTAQVVASDNASLCLKLLNASQQAGMTPRGSTSTQHSGSPYLKTLGGSKDRGEETAASFSGKSSIHLRSIQSMKKETKLSVDTRLYQVLADLTASNETFVDEEFPHDIDSVVAEADKADFLDTHDTIKWLKSSESANFVLFEGIDLNIVKDSPLAGCDVYSALAAMTEFPQRLLRVFTSKESNKQGAYSVNFLVSGIPVEILLDDYFPCTKDSIPLFSRPKANELWFSLLEKAFAKLHGSYNDIAQIPITDALELMTGMPTSQFALKDVNLDELWNQMLEYDEKNYISCAGNSKKDDEKNSRIFSVARLYEKDQYRIVKVKNHFDDFVWRGDFSDGSELWTKDIKEAVGHYKDEKSCFYMELTEFVKYFESLTVCHYQEGLIRNGKEVKCSAKKAVFFEVELDKEMEVFISVHQKLPKFVDEEDYDISPVEILVAEELDEGVLRKVGKGEKDAFMGKSTVYAHDKTRLKLSEGRYIIRVKVRWVDNSSHEFTLNTFSPHPLALKTGKAKNYPDFLERVYLEEGARATDRYQLGNRCEFGSSWCGSHMWLYGTNKGSKTWNLEINFNKIDNLVLSKKYRTSDNVLKLVIPPGGQGVAFVKRVNSKSVELNWNFNQSWE